MAIDGTYKYNQSTPMGPVEGEFVLTSDGSSLAGSVSSKFGKEPIQNGTIDGEKLTWTITAKGPMGEMEIKYDAVVNGDKMQGKAKAGQFPPSDFTAAKV